MITKLYWNRSLYVTMAITPSENVGGTRSYYPRTRANRQFRADSTQNPN